MIQVGKILYFAKCTYCGQDMLPSDPEPVMYERTLRGAEYAHRTCHAWMFVARHDSLPTGMLVLGPRPEGLTDELLMRHVLCNGFAWQRERIMARLGITPCEPAPEAPVNPFIRTLRQAKVELYREREAVALRHPEIQSYGEERSQMLTGKAGSSGPKVPFPQEPVIGTLLKIEQGQSKQPLKDGTYPPNLRWTFEVVAPPEFAGRRTSLTTNAELIIPRPGGKPCSLWRLASSMAGHGITEGELFDEQARIGQLFLLTHEFPTKDASGNLAFQHIEKVAPYMGKTLQAQTPPAQAARPATAKAPVPPTTPATPAAPTPPAQTGPISREQWNALVDLCRLCGVPIQTFAAHLRSAGLDTPMQLPAARYAAEAAWIKAQGPAPASAAGR